MKTRAYHRCRFRGCPFVIQATLDYCPQHADTDSTNWALPADVAATDYNG